MDYYNWITPYTFCVSEDCIVVGWGGYLNSKSETGSMNYYGWTSATNWSDYVNVYTSPRKEPTTNAGMEFYFPQSNGNDSQGHMTKTKSGSVRLDIYQTKAEGKDTKVISNYCHKTLSASGVTISVNSSGPSVSISIGTAYDKTPTQQANISY